NLKIKKCIKRSYIDTEKNPKSETQPASSKKSKPYITSTQRRWKKKKVSTNEITRYEEMKTNSDKDNKKDTDEKITKKSSNGEKHVSPEAEKIPMEMETENTVESNISHTENTVENDKSHMEEVVESDSLTENVIVNKSPVIVIDPNDPLTAPT